MLNIAKTALNRRPEKRNGQHIIKPKATLGQLKVADAFRAEPSMPLPRKQSKIEVPFSHLRGQRPLASGCAPRGDI